jgi:uncharacterized protein
METILIAGGTGLIGLELSKIFIAKGYRVRILSRRKLRSKEMEYFVWDVPNAYLEPNALQGVDHIINLAGANIGAQKWTTSRKKVILESRVQSTQLLYDEVVKQAISLKTFITSSAVGYYGSITSSQVFAETDQPANDFLGSVCRQWETASYAFQNIGIRSVQIRTGVVLSKEEGALPKILKPIRMGLGAVLGSAKQYIPWIHLEDICQIYAFAVENEKLIGAYNAVAPQSIQNDAFTHILAQKINKKILLPAIPEWVLKLILGEMSELVLKGSRVSSNKIQSEGFKFQYENIENALNQLLI